MGRGIPQGARFGEEPARDPSGAAPRGVYALSAARLLGPSGPRPHHLGGQRAQVPQHGWLRKREAVATRGPSALGPEPPYSRTDRKSQAVRWPRPRMRKSPPGPAGLEPRPASSLGDLRFRGWRGPGAPRARAELATAADESKHRAPVKGSPSVLLGAGSRNPAPRNQPRRRLQGLTAGGARAVSMATGFAWRGPRRTGCPAAPAQRRALAYKAAGGRGVAGLRRGHGASGRAGLVGGEGPRAARRRAEPRGLRRGR